MVVENKIEADIAEGHRRLLDGSLGARFAVIGLHQQDDEVRACLASVSPSLQLRAIDRSGGLSARIIWQHESGGTIQETTIATGQWFK